ncbi:MAG: hypothetical protein JWO67_2501 [Streptosporangiaceae bacterium]|jgi:hypothetical protein|nr:hypothetical protein [Streptosporangiaceae bacterium]
MASLVTSSQLASKLQMDLDASSAQEAVDKASGLVRAVARQQFDFVSQETVILSGGMKKLVLPQRPPVIDAGANPLTVVELGDFGGVNFTCLDGRDFVRIGEELTRGQPWYYTVRVMGWPYTRVRGVWAPRVQVTYSHGYQTIPDEVQSVVLDAAAVLYDNPTGLRSVQIDDYTETKATEVLGAAMVASIRDKLGMVGARRQSFSIRTA